MNILERFNFLFNAVRNGRLDVKYLANGNWYTVDWSLLRSMRLGEILNELEENRFEYDGEII